jgi:uncharacterized membrane protein required for colicin V production
MKEKSDAAFGLALAGEWGITLVVLTCLGGFAGYWLGQQIQSSAISILLVLVGLTAGFVLGVMRMLKVQEERLREK